MPITHIGLPAGKIFWGSLLLILCCLFYLVWWAVAFKPQASVRFAKSAVLFGLTAAAGIAGLILILWGITAMPHERPLVPGPWLVLGGVAAYFLLYSLTRVLLKRPVTTELFLIVGWTVLELSAVNALYGNGFLTLTASFALCGVVGLAAAASLVCYVLYYRLTATAGYIMGMVPLILAALTMAALLVILL